MKEFIEKLIGRLEEKKSEHLHDEEVAQGLGKINLASFCSAKARALDGAIQIVNQLAEEYNGGWIPCSERLPEEFKGVIITAIAMNGAYYTEIGKWNGNQWFHGASNTRIDMAEVIAWQPLPEPYKEGE